MLGLVIPLIVAGPLCEFSSMTKNASGTDADTRIRLHNPRFPLHGVCRFWLRKCSRQLSADPLADELMVCDPSADIHNRLLPYVEHIGMT